MTSDCNSSEHCLVFRINFDISKLANQNILQDIISLYKIGIVKKKKKNIYLPLVAVYKQD